VTDLFKKTEIEGCYIFKNGIFRDQRGSFSKVFSSESFKSIGMDISIAEVFFSNSLKGVVRGMHFQAPPHEQAKIVSCLSGRVLDVVLDIRKTSSTYGKAIGIELTADNEKTVVIPKGCAHGFYSYEDNSIISYMVETNHNKVADQGILWNSFKFDWPTSNPIISERDRQFLKFQDFKTPFN
jgi:dTDP-4-dehydrorhamnose 3,5-epimerase